MNQNDAVVATLNPSEDYKTSILSGLSPAVIMEVASRGLGFSTYQSSQEIIYQEHLAKSLTEKYSTLGQQMDQLIHDANAQIKALQEKLQAMQGEMGMMEEKNHELVNAFREKSKAQQHLQQLYQKLKNQCMVPQVADAASNEADFTIQTARADRFVDKLPGTRAGTANFGQFGGPHQQGQRSNQHNREGSGSSGSSGQRQANNFGLGPSWDNRAQSHGVGGRVYTGRKCSLLGIHRSLLTTPHRLRSHWNGLTIPSKQTACSRSNARECVLGWRCWSCLSGIAIDHQTAFGVWDERARWVWIRHERLEEVMTCHKLANWWNTEIEAAC